MRKTFLTLSVPYIDEKEINEVVDTLKSGWISTGPKCRIFEDKFKKTLSTQNTDQDFDAVALSSCTAALHLSLILLGISKDDEIITTPMTFTATANVIEHVGAKPVFVDIEKDTLNIDPKKIEQAITDKTKALMIVHYAGHACDMDKVLEITNKYNVHLIEDAAHGVGGSYKGISLGCFGDFGAFSFYANKNVTSIEGGMLVGKQHLIDKARSLSIHGMQKSALQRYSGGNWYYDVLYSGFKYNMSDVSASIGIHQLDKINFLQERRQSIVDRYNKAFFDNPCLEIPTVRPKIIHSWYIYPLRLNLSKLNIDRDEFIEQLKNNNIGTSVHFVPLHIQPFYKNKYAYSEYSFPVAYEEYKRLISIPLFPKMNDADVNDVISAVINISKKFKK